MFFHGKYIPNLIFFIAVNSTSLLQYELCPQRLVPDSLGYVWFSVQGSLVISPEPPFVIRLWANQGADEGYKLSLPVYAWRVWLRAAAMLWCGVAGVQLIGRSWFWVRGQLVYSQEKWKKQKKHNNASTGEPLAYPLQKKKETRIYKQCSRSQKIIFSLLPVVLFIRLDWYRRYWT